MQPPAFGSLITQRIAWCLLDNSKASDATGTGSWTQTTSIGYWLRERAREMNKPDEEGYQLLRPGSVRSKDAA